MRKHDFSQVDIWPFSNFYGILISQIGGICPRIGIMTNMKLFQKFHLRPDSCLVNDKHIIQCLCHAASTHIVCVPHAACHILSHFNFRCHHQWSGNTLPTLLSQGKSSLSPKARSLGNSPQQLHLNSLLALVPLPLYKHPLVMITARLLLNSIWTPCHKVHSN